MLCPLTRWMISRTYDGGKKMPRFAERHAERCDACRSYARFAASLPSQFSREIPALLDEVPNLPPDRIPPNSGAEYGSRSPFRRRYFLRPIPAFATAGAIVAILAVGIFFFRIGPGSPAPTAAETKAALADLKIISALPDELRGALLEAESPLAKERLILEKSVLSAYAYIQDRLNIKIERKEKSESI